MTSVIGNFSLILSILTGLTVFFVPGKIRAYLYYFSSITPIFSFLLLLSAFIRLDFSVRNVFFNSSANKSLAYRIAGSWSSHEGSMCLWVAMLSLTGLCFTLNTGNKLQIKDKRILIWLLSMIQTVFVGFVYFTSNPFDSFGFKPKDGLGLNPVLQDIALLIHPPILYLGYVGYLIPFAAACMILTGVGDKELLFKIIKRYLNFTMAALTAGIGLGSWWAYRELGWGGFWFFDPVENISLMPWLIGIVLHHFLLITVKTNNYQRVTVLLSLGSFLTVIFGIFLARSGIVGSVHSFAFSPERGNYILAIYLSLTFVALILYALGNKRLKDLRLSLLEVRNHRNTVILTGNILWLVSFIVILIAVLYPVYFSYNFNIDIAIDPNYFYCVFLPIFVPLLILAAIASDNIKFNFSLATLIILSLIITIIVFNIIYLGFSPLVSSAISASIFLMLKTTLYLIRVSNKFQKKISANQIGLFFGHFGFGSLSLAIILNSVLSKEIKFIGTVGDEIKKDGFEIKLHDIKFTENEVYYKQIAEFWIKDDKENLVIINPENRLYKTEKTISREADIISYLTYDLYVVISKIDSDIISAEIYYRPLMSFIWLSAFLIFLGLVSLLFNNSERLSKKQQQIKYQH